MTGVQTCALPIFIGSPGCSYCLGIAADVAQPNEVWLSSQNRNFRNRMGQGSICYLGSAATAAVSSLTMKVVDPMPFIDKIPVDVYESIMHQWKQQMGDVQFEDIPRPLAGLAVAPVEQKSFNLPIIKSKVILFGDHIDTDAIIPATFMPGENDLDLGSHCFEYVRPEFREMVKNGHTIVVGGTGFGSGSSREEAPRSLMGCGVQVVIAKSFAFIYKRNQSNMGLIGIELMDEQFYENLQEGDEIQVDVVNSKVISKSKSYPFTMSFMEKRLLIEGGIVNMYNKYGNGLFSGKQESIEKGDFEFEKRSKKSCETATESLKW